MSRQMYALGKETQQRISRARVLLVGLGGLGVETAKNLVLMGVHELGISDRTPLRLEDCATNFAVHESDVGRRRDEAARGYLAGLSISTDVHVVDDAWDAAVVARYSVVVLTDCVSEAAAVRMDELCRGAATRPKFVWADSRGVSAFVFDDFGESHEVTDADGEVALSWMVASVTNDADGGVVSLVEEGRPEFAAGDLVRFSGVEDDSMAALNSMGPVRVKEVTGRYTLRLDLDTSAMPTFRGAGYVEAVKQPVTLHFEPLATMLRAPGEILVTDWSKPGCERQALLAYRTLWAAGAVPRAHNAADADAFVARMRELNGTAQLVDAVAEPYARVFAMTAAGELPPVVTFIGGVVCQEALKACSGKYTPVHQWMFYDAQEALPDNFVELPESEFAGANSGSSSKYDGVVRVIGRTLQQRLADLKVFVVGAGAIGCEVLKTLAQMGVATGSAGVVHLTDLDSIERSNLSRQFLFRSGDVGKLKSETAVRAIEAMYPGIHMKAMSVRVGEETEDIFTDAFFSGLDCVVTALDNVKARRYIDARCVQTCRPLLDSGTLGPKGSTQDVVPHLTESYSSSSDPPEPTIPFCILHNFPNAIEHTIEWARDKFHGLFVAEPETINNYADRDDFAATLDENATVRLETVRTLYHDLVDARPATVADCVRWARVLFEDYFVNTVNKLLFSFPPDALTAEGVPFWLPPKKCPVPLAFDATNDLHRAFIEAAANLRAFNFGIPQVRNMSAADVEAAVAGLEVPHFVGTQRQVLDEHGNLTDDAGSSSEAGSSSSSSGVADEVAALMAKLPARATLGRHPATPAEFEKDDDSNYHIAFINACSNLRASNYHIPTVDFQRTKFIAGRIIPAMISTTAVVSGLQCTELLKVVQKKPLASYRSAFVNLALPLFAFSEPIACPVKQIREGWTYTMWDKLTVQGDITMAELCKLFQTRYKVDVEMVTCGSALIFSTFLRGETRKRRLAMRVTEAYTEVTKETIDPSIKVIQLVLTCTDAETGEDIDIPTVDYILP